MTAFDTAIREHREKAMSRSTFRQQVNSVSGLGVGYRAIGLREGRRGCVCKVCRCVVEMDVLCAVCVCVCKVCT